ncbi:hypothetical protein JQ594_00625 [Bradyrhizobium manausense]|uniref:hypothetical protein n=1 Tax=Bradyrhizobium manausense TaxID=989370 RepID=UPI001BA751C1|nr:hypothetical protein [Bradyrhizobium manausense]MBR0684407.1 hypothetical protein [Bradyrhizobium manausense]
MAYDLKDLLEGGNGRPAPQIKLVLRLKRGSRDKARGVWYIIDGARSISTGYLALQTKAAERALWRYKTKKIRERTRRRRVLERDGEC